MAASTIVDHKSIYLVEKLRYPELVLILRAYNAAQTKFPR